MRFLFLGDVIGRAGRDALIEAVPGLRRDLALDFIVANGENAAGGFGITEKICGQLFAAGIDVITGGNHSWDQRAIIDYIDHERRLLRPINYPKGTPGKGVALFGTAGGRRVLVINAMGRVFMDAIDDPFAAVDAELTRYVLGRDADFILLDMHGEATSEKVAMGVFADGRASLVVGSHSHVPTADTRILPGGSGFQTDAGMCGDYDSVIGMDKEEPLRRFTRKISGGRMSPANGPATICGVFVESDDRSGLCRRIAPLRDGGVLRPTMPEG